MTTMNYEDLHKRSYNDDVVMLEYRCLFMVDVVSEFKQTFANYTYTLR